MISHRIFSCLFLILLSQYGDAWKFYYPDLEIIQNSLERIVDLLSQQVEQNTLNCLVPAEKLFYLLTQLEWDNNENPEIQFKRKSLAPLNSDSNYIFQKVGLDHERDHPEHYFMKNRNKNYNENTNINTNANYARRTLQGLAHNKVHNVNRNVNYNVNANLNKRPDILHVINENDENKEP